MVGSYGMEISVRLIDITEKLKDEDVNVVFLYHEFSSQAERIEFWICSQCYHGYDYSFNLNRKFMLHCPECVLKATSKELLDKCRLVPAWDTRKRSRGKCTKGRLINFLFNREAFPTLAENCREKLASEPTAAKAGGSH